MSSVRLVPFLRLPVLASQPRRRRLVVVGGAILLLAALALVMLDPIGLGSKAKPDRGTTATLAEARARAVARATAAAAVRAKAKEAAPATPSDRPERVAETRAPAALFATHSWYTPPPPPPAAAPAPPPPPSAPPFPYTYVGSYAPVGEKPVYFLAKADRVFDAHVGDRLDGVFEFEKVEAGALVFNYLPLNIRQSLPAGVTP